MVDVYLGQKRKESYMSEILVDIAPPNGTAVQCDKCKKDFRVGKKTIVKRKKRQGPKKIVHVYLYVKCPDCKHESRCDYFDSKK